MAGKRIVFSTATPNDQGGVIPNDVIDFSRFNSNPVVLCQHKWGDPPLGLMTDIQYMNGEWSGVPVFNRITAESKEYADLYDGGWIKACSIGGQAIWATTGKKIKGPDGQMYPEYKLDADGNRTCLKFFLYEISIVTLPSNGDAVTKDAYEAKFYEDNEIGNVNSNIEKFFSQFNSAKMQKTPEEIAAENAKKTPEQLAAEKLATEKLATEKLAATPPATTATPAVNSTGTEIPAFLKDIVGLMGTLKDMFAPKEAQPVTAAPAVTLTTPAAPAPIAATATTTGKPDQTQNQPTGLEALRQKAEAAINSANALKLKADATGATEADKVAYQTALTSANAAMSDLEAADKKAKEKPDEKEGDKEASTNASKPNTNIQKPVMKTIEELKAEQLKLAPSPAERTTVGQHRGATFTQLSSPKNDEGQRIINRVMTTDGGEKTIEDYAVVLESIMRDGRYSAITEKLRIMQNVNESQLASYQTNPQNRAGKSMKHLAAELASGSVEMLGRDNVLRSVTTLNSSDDALVSPALSAIEWLPLAIYKLFPSDSWKSSIPIFSAQEVGNNLGLIWANITADPAITKGAQPATNQADYTYNDDAVALKLTPYWLQPMRWTPLTMHMLRYDPMSTGWAQAFAKWGAVMDDDMIYTLASTVPAGSIVKTNGGSFSIVNNTDPNSFYYGTFTGNLAKPQLNDVIRLEQIWSKQNFQLDGERPVLVMDPTYEALVSQDPQTQSLLTRWVNADNAALLKFKHTTLTARSRVAVYDPATGQVKDNNGAIPATAVSANLAFIPSQVGIGLGMMDVFMIQDPSAYGYRMSADIRIGTVPMRKNYDGTALVTYGDPQI